MSQPISNNATFRLFLVFSIIFVVVIGMGNLLVPDSYLHFGIGRYILSRHSIPGQTDISYKEAAPSLEWISHSWLFDVLAYMSFRPSETFGPLLVLIPITIGAFVLLQHLFSLHHISRCSETVSTTIGALLLLSFWKMHPLIASLILLLSVEVLFEEWRLHRSKLLYLLPFVGILFANVSGGYILLFALLVTAFTFRQVLMARLFPTTTSWIAPLLGTITLLATLINPYGFRLYLYGLTGYALLGNAKWYSTLAGALEVTNTSIFKSDVSPAYYILFLLYGLVTVISFTFLLIRTKQKFLTKIYPLIPTGIFLWFGFFFVRFIPLAVFVTLPLFGVTIDSLIKSLPKHFRQRKIWPVLSLFSAILVMCVWAAFPPRQTRFAPPSEQCKILKENKVPPNILVSTEITGYIYYCLFPQKQQIDARDDFFDSNDTIGAYGRLSTISDENIREFVDDNEINAILTSKENDYVTTYFGKKSDWALFYIDYDGILFLRSSQVDPNTLAHKKLNFVDLSRNLGFDPTRIKDAITEMENFTSRYPQNILALGQLSSLYRFDGQLRAAESTLKKIPESQWNFPLNTEMGRIKAAQGDCEASEHYFLTALSIRGEQNVSKTVLDIAILYAACFHDMSKAKHYLERYMSYPLPEEERERATQLAKKFTIELDSK